MEKRAGLFQLARPGELIQPTRYNRSDDPRKGQSQLELTVTGRPDTGKALPDSESGGVTQTRI